MTRTIRASIVICGLLCARAAQALPEDQGTLKIQELSRTETIAQTLVSFDLYVPEVTRASPIVAIGHGFAGSRQMLADWGRLLASRGYVAAAPDFPAPGSDHATDAKILSGLLDWLVTESQKSGSPLAGRVDGSRRGVMGHSAGGLAALLAASTDAQVGVMVGLDPVDASDLGKAAAPSVKAPVAFIRGDPSACNGSGNAAAMYAALAAPALSLQVVAATHCDPEWPADFLCGLVCGAADDTRRTRFVRYAMATLDYVLLCDSSMAPWLGGASAKADPLVQNLTLQGGFPAGQLGCAPTADAGVDAARRDFAAGRDGATPDTGRADAARTDLAGADAAGPAPPGSGCGCHLASDLPRRPWPLLLLPLLVLVVVTAIARHPRRRSS